MSVENVITLGKLKACCFHSVSPSSLFCSLQYYSEKTSLKKLMIIGERAKRARHSQVCSIENRGYIYIIYI